MTVGGQIKKNTDSSNYPNFNTKFARDYDKEPIIIKDHNPEFAFIASIASVPLIILMLIYFPTSEEKIIKALFYTLLLISPIVLSIGLTIGSSALRTTKSNIS